MNLRIICGYQIVRQLARGGMGVVYLGRARDTGDLVAIKTLNENVLAADGSWQARFLREGQALRELNHPNIVKMLAMCQEDDQYFIVMEYLDGGSLADKIAESDSPLPLAGVLDIALQLADALTRAHYLNIIHRDLKPANVLMSADGRACVTDFGLALRGPSELTVDGAILGTLSYLSPEVVQGQPATQASDIWSFGVLLFEMLAGVQPFLAESASATLFRILSEPPRDLESLRPDAPIQLVDLIYRMLHKDPAQRIDSSRQVGAALEAIGRDESADLHVWDLTGQSFATPPGRVAQPTLKKLPRELTPFLGREREMNEFKEMLTDEDTRLITLIGPGGIGKTRLAIEAARIVASYFQDGVAFIPLAELNSIDSLIPAIWDAVDYPPLHADTRTPEEQTLAFFADKEMLLIFDNCEHLLEGSGLIRGILREASAVRVLATTTERLNLQGETLYRLKGIDYPHYQAGNTALDFAAVRLFVDASRRWRPGFEVTEKNLPDIVRICQLVQGLPLAILLAAAWIDALSVRAIADEIAADIDFLSTEMRDVPERQRSIRATFDGAWRRLSADEQATFARLAVFRGGFDLEAARTVAGASVRNLLSLTSKSLLWRDAADGRYNVHRLLRQYAQAELVLRGELEDFRRRHAEYYAELAEFIDRQLREPNDLPWYGRLRLDNDNFLTALDWALMQEQDPVLGGRLFAGLGIEWFMTDNVVDGTVWMERSLKFVDKFPVDVRARVYNRSGLIGCVQGNYAQAANNHAQSVEIFRRLGDDGHLAYALLAQANMSRSAGMGKIANTLIEESLSVAYRAEDPYFLALALSGAANFARQAGDDERARRLLLERITLTESFPNHVIRYGTLRSEAFMARHVGHFELALKKLEQALEIALELRWQPDEIDAMEEIAYTHYLTGNLRQSMAEFSSALQKGRRIGHFTHVAWNLIGLGMVALKTGDNQQAYARYRERLQCQPDKSATFQVALCLAGLAKLAWLAQHEEESATMLGASEAAVERGDLLPFPWFTEDWQQIMSELKGQLAGDAWERGRNMPMDQAVDHSLQTSLPTRPTDIF